MSFILGIDTGGTNTDGVIIDSESKEIRYTSKAPTTKHDLSIGVRACIEAMPFSEFSQIKLVSLSTTLATNAIVEGKVHDVGLLIIGDISNGKLPVQHYTILSGAIDIKGNVTEALDETQCRNEIKRFVGLVDAVAVSGFASVRNPVHEIEVKKMVQEILQVPVVCAHELSSNLGFYERTVTATINAQLIPITCQLIESIKVVLKEKGIQAPIMVVKGDGTLMSVSLAEEKPIETILSGPAASIIGGQFLSGIYDNGIIIDMGGTTSDIAGMDDGIIKINEDGATVGGWKTKVQAADIFTYGLGGDSHLRFDYSGNILVGPRRVIPLCVGGMRYPKLKKELEYNYAHIHNSNSVFQNCDCFALADDACDADNTELSDTERDIWNLLSLEPHSFLYISKTLSYTSILHSLKKMIDKGLLQQISFTPTDILHIQGKFNRWDTDFSILGASILADTLGKTSDEIVSLAENAVITRMFMIILNSLSCFEGGEFDFEQSKEACNFFEKALYSQPKRYYHTAVFLDKPLIAIGAPAEIWGSKVAKKLNAVFVAPKHAEVASAVGAAVGKILESVTVLIRPGDGNVGYVLHAPWELKKFGILEDAVDYALKNARARLIQGIEMAGSKDYKLTETCEHIETETKTGQSLYIETWIHLTAVGVPSWN